MRDNDEKNYSWSRYGGKRKMMFLDVNANNKKRLISWNGYRRTTNRSREPIGAGRLISRGILDKLNWQSYNIKDNRNMDYTSFTRVLRAGGRVEIIEDPCDTIMALSLSFFHKWGNLHGFESLCTRKSSAKRVLNTDEALRYYFRGINQGV